MIETHFSIYKIDQSKFETVQGIKDKGIDERIKEVKQILLSEMIEQVSQRKDATYHIINNSEIKGIVYQTINIPEWNGMITDLTKSRAGKSIEFDLENINISYVLLYSVCESIYAMTAGYGKHLIKSHIENNWGMYLMPKLLGQNEGVIRNIAEINMYGNTVAVSKVNRSTTELEDEKRMNAIFRGLSLEVDYNVIEELGLLQGENKKAKIGVELKDSLNIKKAITLSELKRVLKVIYEIEKKPDGYSMGYYVEVKKAIDISGSVLFNELVELICYSEIDEEGISLAMERYQEYYVESQQYRMLDENNRIIYSEDEPITIPILLEMVKKNNRFYKGNMETALKKWKIYTLGEAGNTVLSRTPVIDLLQTVIEYGDNKVPCFLIQGRWYCLATRYIPEINEKYKKLYKKFESEGINIKNKFNLINNENSENSYNDSFMESTNIIVAHKSTIDNLEIADLIFWDENYVYLMCNKRKFDASGSRDLTNQMAVSARYLQHRLESLDRKDFLEEFYRKIEMRYRSESEKQQRSYNIGISKPDFVKLFDREIYYIAGYISGYSIASRSSYAKYLTIDTYREFSKMNMKFLCMSI